MTTSADLKGLNLATKAKKADGRDDQQGAASRGQTSLFMRVGWRGRFDGS
jgi:hypothetical protein